MHQAKVVQVIVTDLRTVGRGTTNDPVRCVKQIWTLDGEMIAECEMDVSAPTNAKIGPGWERLGEGES